MRKFLLLLFAMTGSFMLYAQQTPTTDSLREYTGRYKFPEGSVVTEVIVIVENGLLQATSVMGNTELKKIEKDLFAVVAYSGTAQFKRSQDGKINGVKIEVDDLVLEGTKSEESITPPTRLQR